MSDDVYAVTLPAALPHHTLLRKLYAIIAFAAAGYVVSPLFERKHHAIRHGLVSVSR